MIGAGLLADVPALLAERCPAAAYAVITDDVVAARYGTTLANDVAEYRPCRLFDFPAGESSKTRSTWSSLTDAMLAARLGRDCAVVAVGGGVVGDLAGFVAASYMRGVPLVQVPTTLLAMIDSSTGGKTGVDTPHGKNLVGAFHQPRMVVCDTATLGTLPERQLRAGAAEAVKHGAIADRTYFDRVTEGAESLLGGDPATLASIVAGSVRIKAAVVAADEREAGLRAILNFGHTVGHAIEVAAGFAGLHGEAVSAGMVCEAALGERTGVTVRGTADALRDALGRFDLPLTIAPGITPDALLDAMGGDKKNRAGTIRFSLIERLGTPARTGTGETTSVVPQSVLESYLSEVA